MVKYLLKNKALLAATMVLGAITAVASVFISLILQRIIDIAIQGDVDGFFRVLVFTVIYILVLCLISYIAALFGKMLLRNVTARLRKDVFNGVMRRTPTDFLKENTADYLSALTNDIKMIEENYILPLLVLVDFTIMIIATLGVLLYLSPMVTLFLCIGAVLMFLVPVLLGKALSHRQERVSQQLSIFTGQVKDFLKGYEVIRGFCILPHIRQAFDGENKKTADIKFKADKMLALNDGLSEVLSNLIVVIVVFVGAYLVLKQSITVGTLVALVQLSGTFVAPVMMILQVLPRIKGIAPVAARLEEFANYEPTEFQGSTEPKFEKAITVKDLTFGYTQENPILHGINQSFKKGKKYAIVGKSGCGKSTLIRLLTAYSAQYEGKIEIDGQELRDSSEQRINQLMAVIHQNIYMFDSTVGENIALGQEFSQAAWDSALEISGVNMFLPGLEKGLDTPVGEDGANLSGGQRQRIAVARALIRQTPVMILDEGTSSIDRQTAAEIEGCLLSQADLTIITITHNLDPELLNKYDEIIYMEDGKIGERGDFQTLQAAGKSFTQFQS